MLKLIKFANVYIISKLVKEFDKESEPFDSGSNCGLEDLDAIFTLDFLEVNKNQLWSNRSGWDRHGRYGTIEKEDLKAGSKRLFVCLFTFSIGGTMSTSLFWLMAESKAVFIFSRVWTTMGLLNKSKINYILIKEDESRDKACDCTDICISVSVRLTGLAMHV
jgi:hypothetical protein